MKEMFIYVDGTKKYRITFNDYKGPESGGTLSKVLTLTGANAPKMDPQLNGKITFTGDAPLSGTIELLRIITIGTSTVKLEW